MKNKGVTLIELIVVISIIGILAVALGFSYVGWQGRYKVEKETKDLYADLMTARSLAMTRNRYYFVDFPTPTTYRIIEDVNDSSASDAGDTVLPTYPRTVEYAVTWTGGTIEFDKRGIIQPSATPLGGTIRIITSSTTDPDYDCIVISRTRIIAGKLNGANCEEK